MVSSTEIPKPMLKTKIVEGFIGMFKKPINPAVINKGKIFGSKEIRIICGERNIQAIKIAIKRIANDNETTKFVIK